MAPSCAGSIPVVRLLATQPNLGTVRAKGRRSLQPSAPRIVWAPRIALVLRRPLGPWLEASPSFSPRPSRCVSSVFRCGRLEAGGWRLRRPLAFRSTGALGTPIALPLASPKAKNSRHSLAIGLADSGILDPTRRRFGNRVCSLVD